MFRTGTLSVCLLLGIVATTGCAVSHAASPGVMHPRAEAAPAPAPIDRSYFARDPGGALTEESLQKLLATPIEVALPARVGVLPILPAADHRGPGPSYDQAPQGSTALTSALRGMEPFTLVTEVMPIPSGALGMEALREIAARYRLRYLLLYREDVTTRKRANGWAAGYLTILGAFFLPGQTLLANGYVEASLFDVKTGNLLFTVRRRVDKRRVSNVWHGRDKMHAMVTELATTAAPELAQDIRMAVARVAEAAQAEKDRGQKEAPLKVAQEIGNANVQSGGQAQK